MTTQLRSPRARALCAALREIRQARGFGVRELARKLQIQHSTLSNYESGARIPSVETVALILGALGAPSEERARLLDLARNAADSHWLTDGIAGIPQQLAGAIECERAASVITEWIPLGIPGLLQTPDYARSVKASSGALSQSDVDIRVMVNSGRRDILVRRDPVTFHALISQATFHEPVGEPGMMAGQLRYLLDMAKLRNVTLHFGCGLASWLDWVLYPV